MSARRRTFVWVAVAVAAALLPGSARAQEDGPVRACEAASPGDAAFCRTVAQAAEALVPTVVAAASGGNPVPGTASTLGMRLTSAPRWSLGFRTTAIRSSAPDVLERGGTRTLNVMPGALALDGSVGILTGWNPLPTVGGVLSLDALFGVALLPLFAGDDYGGSGGWSWNAGARLGVLRESFTLPGASLSAVYRQVRSLRLGDEELATADSWMRGDVSAIGLRATVSKSIVLLNLTGGIGYDYIYGDLELGYDSGFGATRVPADDVTMERLIAFGSVSYTLMVLHFVIGGGWQEAPPAIQGADTGDWAPTGAFFGSFALRVSI